MISRWSAEEIEETCNGIIDKTKEYIISGERIGPTAFVFANKELLKENDNIVVGETVPVVIFVPLHEGLHDERINSVIKQVVSITDASAVFIVAEATCVNTSDEWSLALAQDMAISHELHEHPAARDVLIATLLREDKTSKVYIANIIRGDEISIGDIETDEPDRIDGRMVDFF